MDKQNIPASDLASRYPFARLESFAGVWAMHAPAADALMSVAGSGQDVLEHLRKQEAVRQQVVQKAGEGMTVDRYGYSVVDGIALVSIEGTMMKQASSLGGTSTAMVRRDLRTALADDSVRGALLVVDSPGGHSAGTDDLADDVAAFAARKPIVAFGEDLVASAAYWVASQASELFVNRSALVGSIGTYAVVRDWSSAMAANGVKTYVVRAGAYKGMGTPGTEITPEALAELQRVVDTVNAPFVAAVASGRKLPQAKAEEMADGRIHGAADAVRLGLANAVASIDQAMERVRQLAAQRTNPTGARAPGQPAGSGGSNPAQRPRSSPMSTTDTNAASQGGNPATTGGNTAGGAAQTASTNDSARPATIAELRATFNDADFVLEQADKAATMTEAKREWDFLQRRLSTQQAQSVGSIGVRPLNDAPPAPKAGVAAAGGGDAIDRWNAAVDEAVKGGKSRSEAVASLVKSDAELHLAYIEAHNAKHARQRPRR